MTEALYLNQLVSSLKETLNGGTISADNCMQLLSRGMIFAEKLAVLSDSEKKLVIDALIQIMNEFKTEENAQEMVVVQVFLKVM